MTSPSRGSATAALLSLLLIGCAHTPSGPEPERPKSEPAGEKTETPESAPQEGARDQAGASAEDADAAKRVKVRALTISIGSQQFKYVEDGALVRTGPISSGARGYTTPTGKFAVLSKNADKVSSRYTNQLGMQAWMPYAIQFHGHYFLHEGWLPGYPDSHGCIRVGAEDARFLFDTLKIGDPVTVKK